MRKPLRVAVHTIVLNEAAFLPRWAASAADADLIQITDTGSTDETVQVARELGVRVTRAEVDPWRFDHARNMAIALLPKDLDVMLTLDADEILMAGWREKLEKAYRDNPKAGQFTYQYVWSWTADGWPDVQFDGERCVTRTGWRWKHPVHEVLEPVGERPAKVHAGFSIEHHPDPDKSRGGYLGLLELAVEEEPQDPRSAFYYARELYFVGRWNDARIEAVRFLRMPQALWPPERAAAWRLLAKMDHHPERWLLRAVAEDPDRRESWVALAEHWSAHGHPVQAAGAAARALQITERQGDYLTDAGSWDDDRLHAIVAKAAARGVFE